MAGLRGSILEFASGIFILIGIFLFVKNWEGTTKIISTIASNSIQGIKVLQGR